MDKLIITYLENKICTALLSEGRVVQMTLESKEHPSRPPASSTSATPSGVRRLRARSQRPVPFSPQRAIRLTVSPGRRS